MKTLLNNRYIITSGIIALACIFTGLVTQQSLNTRSQAQPTSWQELQTYWHAELERMENKVWQELNRINITKKETLQLREKDYHIYTEKHKPFSNQPLDKQTETLVKKILQELNLKTQTIPFFSWNRGVAATLDHSIYVNEQQLMFYPVLAQKFIIAHELQHFIHKDHSMRFFIKAQIPEQQTTPADQPLELDSNHPYLQYVRFTEQRADILAAIATPELAHAYQEFAETLSSFAGNDQGETHPKVDQRLAVAHNILAMQQSITV